MLWTDDQARFETPRSEDGLQISNLDRAGEEQEKASHSGCEYCCEYWPQCWRRKGDEVDYLINSYFASWTRTATHISPPFSVARYARASTVLPSFYISTSYNRL